MQIIGILATIFMGILSTTRVGILSTTRVGILSITGVEILLTTNNLTIVVLRRGLLLLVLWLDFFRNSCTILII